MNMRILRSAGEAPAWTVDDNRLLGIERLSFFRTPFGVSANQSREIIAGREEVEFLVRGQATFDHEGREHRLGPGAILWHCPGHRTVYRTRPDDPYACVVFVFRVGPRRSAQPPRLSLSVDPGEACAFAMDLLAAFHGGGVDLDLLARHAWQALHWRMLRAGSSAERPDLPHPLRLLLADIDRRFAEALTLADLTDIAGLGASRLSQLCRSHLGCPPMRLVLNRRLAEARRLLATTEHAVADIGRQVGFGDPVHFGRSFAQAVGLSPGAYRARYRVRGG